MENPTANLHEQLALIQKIGAENRKATPDLERLADYATQLAELVYEMNNWLKVGGRLPVDWER